MTREEFESILEEAFLEGYNNAYEEIEEILDEDYIDIEDDMDSYNEESGHLRKMHRHFSQSSPHKHSRLLASRVYLKNQLKKLNKDNKMSVDEKYKKYLDISKKANKKAKYPGKGGMDARFDESQRRLQRYDNGEIKDLKTRLLLNSRSTMHGNKMDLDD